MNTLPETILGNNNLGDYRFSFDVERSVLSKVLSHLQNIVEKKTTLPILSNILLTLKNGQLYITATDLELDAIESIPVLSPDNGSITVPMHTLYDIVRKIPDDSTMRFLCEETHVKLTANRAKFSLPALPASEYPTISQIAVKHTFTLPAVELKILLQKTKFCMSTLETRYALNGVYCHLANDSVSGTTLRTVALDGHRLAMRDYATDDCPSFEPFIIPKKAVNELCRLLDDCDDTVQVNLTNNKISININRLSISSKLIDDTFPEYKQIIPQLNDALKIKVNTSAIKQAVDRVATMTNDKFNGVSFNITNSHITINANSSGFREGTEDVACDFNGENLKLNFNARFLLDILSQIDGENTVFYVRDNVTAVIIRDSNNDQSTFIMMPLR